MRDTVFYKIVKPLLTLFITLFRPKIIGKENISGDTNYILVGNHTSKLDPILIVSTVKRQVHFFAKNSLYRGLKKPIFKGMGIIPVNRMIKDKESLNMGIMALKHNLVVGIFPEGTINKTTDVIMPFKFGAVKMAKETGREIVPFVIVNKYKLFKSSVIIIYGKPYKVIDDDLDKENNILMGKITKMIIENKK